MKKIDTLTPNKSHGRVIMASYGDPQRFTKGEVRRAGQALANGGTELDREIVNNWRNSHAYILNTFQATLRLYMKRQSPMEIVFAQRLKRLNTIVDKLKSGRARDLSSMHDLAGCRLIFSSIEDIAQFREAFHGTKARHIRDDKGRYDYIANPKSTGYRGVHEVYKYVAQTEGGRRYDDLKIEIQYRTKTQHSWATAVEISDLLDGARIKFDQNANPMRERLFVLASEYLARTKESMYGACPELTDEQLCREMSELEGQLGVINTLDMARRSSTEIPQRKHVILHFHNGELSASGYGTASRAMAYRDEIEGSYPDDDVVYVTAQSPSAIADAFKNYFRDAVDFVESIKPALR
ncbi:RelA/SpoT domain-containing protein [Alcaligenes sp. Marseille-Q7550]